MLARQQRGRPGDEGQDRGPEVEALPAGGVGTGHTVRAAPGRTTSSPRCRRPRALVDRGEGAVGRAPLEDLLRRDRPTPGSVSSCSDVAVWHQAAFPRGKWQRTRPAPLLVTTGGSSAQVSEVNLQRGWNAPPVGRSSMPGTTPGIVEQPLSDRTRVPARQPTAPQCRDAAGWRTDARSGASSAICPAYITITRCAVSSNNAHVVGDQHQCRAAVTLQRYQQLEDLRLDRDVQRRGRFVGDHSSGLQAIAMAIITRWRMPPELVRKSRAVLRGRNADLPHQVDGAVRAAARRSNLMMQRAGFGDLPADRRRIG